MSTVLFGAIEDDDDLFVGPPAPRDPRPRGWTLRRSTLRRIAILSYLAGVVLVAVAPFAPLFSSVTTWRAPAGVGTRISAFVFDGFGRPVGIRSADSVGFPFAGHGPNFAYATACCAIALVIAGCLHLETASRWLRLSSAPVALAAGGALLAVAGSMWLTVQPGVRGTAAMQTVTTVGACFWCTAVAGVLVVAGGVAARTAHGRSGPVVPRPATRSRRSVGRHER